MDSRFKDKNIREPLQGFHDTFGQEARVKNFLSAKIAETFQKWGYGQIILPTIERGSSFSEEVIGGSPWPEWNKRGIFYLHIHDYFTSYNELPQQTPAILIPEGTISVSRWLSREMNDKLLSKSLTFFPKKVFYIAPCFRNELVFKLSEIKKREFVQVGLEILGTDNILSDIECFLLLYNGFRSIGIQKKDILFRFGNVKLFNSICDESNIEEHSRIILKDKLDILAEVHAGKQVKRANSAIKSIFEIINAKNLPRQVIEKWRTICNTYVDKIDEKTRKTLGNNEFIDELEYIVSVAKGMGINSIIDFSVVRSHEYYTGIVFEVDLKTKEQSFIEVAGGGRYNKLISKFFTRKKSQIPAVGFAYGLDRVYEFIKKANSSGNKTEKINYWVDQNDTDIIMFKKQDSNISIENLFRSANKLRNKNKRVDIYVGDKIDLKNVRAYTFARNAKLIAR